MTDQDERLTAIEERLARIEDTLTRFHDMVAPVMANPSRWLARLMGGGGK